MASIVEHKEPETQTPRAVEDKDIPAPPGRNRLRSWMAIGVVLIAVAAGTYAYLQYASGRETTDDAQIEGHIHPVGARVGGTVTRTFVQNNQMVEAGAILAEIDPQDYQVAVARAKANLAEAEADFHESRTRVPLIATTSSSGLSGAEAGVAEARANIATAGKQVAAAQARLSSAKALVLAAKAGADRAARDLERMRALVAKEEISQQQFDASSAAADASRAQLDSTVAQVNEAEQSVRVAESQLEEQRARLAKAQAEAAGARTGPQQVASAEARVQSTSAKVMQLRAEILHARSFKSPARFNHYTKPRRPSVLSLRRKKKSHPSQEGVT